MSNCAQACELQQMKPQDIQSTRTIPKLERGQTVRFEYKDSSGHGGKTAELGSRTTGYGSPSTFVMNRDDDGNLKVDINKNLTSLKAFVKGADGKETEIDLMKNEEAVAQAPQQATSPKAVEHRSTILDLAGLAMPLVERAGEAAREGYQELQAKADKMRQGVEVGQAIFRAVSDGVSSAMSAPGARLYDEAQDSSSGLTPRGFGGGSDTGVELSEAGLNIPFDVRDEPLSSVRRPEVSDPLAGDSSIPTLTEAELKAALEKRETEALINAIRDDNVELVPPSTGSTEEFESPFEEVVVADEQAKPAAEPPVAEKPVEQGLDLSKLEPGTKLRYFTANGSRGEMIVPSVGKLMQAEFRGAFHRNQDGKTFTFKPDAGENLEISVVGEEKKSASVTGVTAQPKVPEVSVSKEVSKEEGPGKREGPFNVVTAEQAEQFLRENPDQKVIIQFSAWYCGPCKSSVPNINGFKKQHPEATILKIETTNRDNRDFLTRHGIDTVPRTFVRYPVEENPEIAAGQIDPTQTLHQEHVGYITTNDLQGIWDKSLTR